MSGPRIPPIPLSCLQHTRPVAAVARPYEPPAHLHVTVPALEIVHYVDNDLAAELSPGQHAVLPERNGQENRLAKSRSLADGACPCLRTDLGDERRQRFRAA